MIMQLGNYNVKQHKRSTKDVCAMKFIFSGTRSAGWASGRGSRFDPGPLWILKFDIFPLNVQLRSYYISFVWVK